MIEHPPDRLDAVELVPFKKAIAVGVAGIMTAHILVPAIDEERPGTLSPAIVTGLLKQKLGFQGMVFTDDIGMKAISARYSTAEATAGRLAAGCDAVLMCGDSQEPQFEALEAVIHAVEDGTLPLPRIEDALARHRRAKERFLRRRNRARSTAGPSARFSDATNTRPSRRKWRVLRPDL